MNRQKGFTRTPVLSKFSRNLFGLFFANQTQNEGGKELDKTGVSSAKAERGFTLIELLVVIAIIGILASVITVNLTSTKNKSSNTGIKTNLATVRSQAEVYYNQNSYVYGSYSGACPTVSGTGHVFLDPVVVSAMNAAKSASGGTAQCWANGNQWSASVQLRVPEGSANHWCVDSTAAGRGTATAPSSSLCP